MTDTVNPSFTERADYETGFSVYFADNIAPLLEDLEAERLAALKVFKLSVILGVLAVGVVSALLFFSFEIFHAPGFTLYIDAFAGAFSKHGNGTDEGKLKIFFTIAIIAIMIPSSIAACYGDEAKTILLPPLLRFFGDLKYDLANEISADEFSTYEVMPAYSGQAIKNHITGTLDNITLDLVQLSLWLGGGKSKTSVFEGIAVQLQLNKPFEGKTIVKTHFWSRQHPAKAGVNNELQVVKLEDVVFDRWFDVYSSDQVEARCVLTPTLMEQLMQLATLMHTWGDSPETFKTEPESHSISCGFYNKGLFLMIPCSIELFQPGSIFESAYNFNDMRKVLHQISLIRGIIKTLELDKRAGVTT